MLTEAEDVTLIIEPPVLAAKVNRRRRCTPRSLIIVDMTDLYHTKYIYVLAEIKLLLLHLLCTLKWVA